MALPITQEWKTNYSTSKMPFPLPEEKTSDLEDSINEFLEFYNDPILTRIMNLILFNQKFDLRYEISQLDPYIKWTYCDSISGEQNNFIQGIPRLFKGNSSIPGLKFILPNAYEFDGFERKLFVASEFLKYVATGIELGYVEHSKDNPVSLINHATYFFMTPNERQAHKKGRDEMFDYMLIETETEYQEIKEAMLYKPQNEIFMPRVMIGGEKHKMSKQDYAKGIMDKILPQLQKFGTKIGNTVFYCLPRDVRIQLSSDDIYNSPSGGIKYRKATKANSGYGPVPHQKNLLNDNLESGLFGLSKECSELQLYFLGGGSLEEEADFIINFLKANIDFIRSKGSSYNIRIISVEKNSEQLTQAHKLEINGRVNEVINNYLFEKEGKNYTPFDIDINPKIIPGNFITDDYRVESNNPDKSIERIIVSATSTISNLEDTERIKMLENAYKVIGDSKGRVLIGSALIGDKTDYKEKVIEEFVGSNLFNLGMRGFLKWSPYFDNKNGRHQLEFKACVPDGYDPKNPEEWFMQEYLDEHGQSHIIHWRPDTRINFTYSRRDTVESLKSLAKKVEPDLNRIKVYDHENKYAILELRKN